MKRHHSFQNLHSFKTQTFHSLLLECEQQKSAIKKQNCYSFCQDLSSSCSAHSWTAHVCVAKWNGSLRFRKECKHLTSESSLKYLASNNRWVYMWVIVSIYDLNLAFHTCPSHAGGWSIFIIHRAHVHTPPGLLTPEIVTTFNAHHGHLTAVTDCHCAALTLIWTWIMKSNQHNLYGDSSLFDL